MGSPKGALADAAILTQVIDEAYLHQNGKGSKQLSIVEIFRALDTITDLYSIDEATGKRCRNLLRVMHAGSPPLGQFQKASMSLITPIVDTSMDWWQKLSQVELFTESNRDVSLEHSRFHSPSKSISQDDDALSLSVFLNSDIAPSVLTPSTIKRPLTSSRDALFTGQNLVCDSRRSQITSTNETHVMDS